MGAGSSNFTGLVCSFHDVTPAFISEGEIPKPVARRAMLLLDRSSAHAIVER